jgi:hypothetical protein
LPYQNRFENRLSTKTGVEPEKCKKPNNINWEHYKKLAEKEYRSYYSTECPGVGAYRHRMADIQAAFFDKLSVTPCKNEYVNKLKGGFGNNIYLASEYDKDIKYLFRFDRFKREFCEGISPETGTGGKEKYFFVFVSLDKKGMIIVIGKSSITNKGNNSDLFIPSTVNKIRGTDNVICYHLEKNVKNKECLEGTLTGKLPGKLEKIYGSNLEKKLDALNDYAKDIIVIPVDAKNARTYGQIETAVGQFLIDNGYPVLDYYSHL